MDKNSVTISIDETGGNSKTSATVYKIDKNGRITTVGTKWFNDTEEKKARNSEKLTFNVSGAKNHIIILFLNGDSKAETFKYKLRVN